MKKKELINSNRNKLIYMLEEIGFEVVKFYGYNYFFIQNKKKNKISNNVLLVSGGKKYFKIYGIYKRFSNKKISVLIKNRLNNLKKTNLISSIYEFYYNNEDFLIFDSVEKYVSYLNKNVDTFKKYYSPYLNNSDYKFSINRFKTNIENFLLNEYNLYSNNVKINIVNNRIDIKLKKYNVSFSIDILKFQTISKYIENLKLKDTENYYENVNDILKYNNFIIERSINFTFNKEIINFETANINYEYINKNIEIFFELIKYLQKYQLKYLRVIN